jgi:von Willebrand factor type A domain-containing protein
MHPRLLGAVAGAAALAGALALVPGASAGTAGAPAAIPAAACSPVTNIEAIVDDSGSMTITDPNRLRVAALDLLIDTPGNEKITLGAVEFGGTFGTFPGQPPAADAVFPPEAIGPNAAAMRTALDQKIHADNGLTDYNAAFSTAQASNPGAKARIFLTDGGHDAGPYNNGHRGGPPTYVIGFGSAISGADGQRLQQIASDTGGKYFPQTDSSKLQAVMNEIGTTLTCQSPPVRFSDAFKRVGQGKSHAVALASSARSVQLTLTWANPADKFTVSRVRIVSRGRTVALARARHLKLTTRRGPTFLVVKVSGVTRGSLRFTVKPTTLGSNASRVSLTTQVTQSRRR